MTHTPRCVVGKRGHTGSVPFSRLPVRNLNARCIALLVPGDPEGGADTQVTARARYLSHVAHRATVQHEWRGIPGARDHEYAT
jgi:hypothetical protein